MYNINQSELGYNVNHTSSDMTNIITMLGSHCQSNPCCRVVYGDVIQCYCELLHPDTAPNVA